MELFEQAQDKVLFFLDVYQQYERIQNGSFVKKLSAKNPKVSAESGIQNPKRWGND
jgi:hypothetical protein